MAEFGMRNSTSSSSFQHGQQGWYDPGQQNQGQPGWVQGNYAVPGSYPAPSHAGTSFGAGPAAAASNSFADEPPLLEGV